MTSIAPASEENNARRERSKRLVSLNSSAVACALTLILMNGVAAQAPKDSPPDTAKATTLTVQTRDGRAFSALSEKDVDALTRPDKKAYYAWRNAGLDTELALVEKQLEAARSRLAELDVGIAGEWKNIAAMFRQLPPHVLSEFLRKDVPRITKLFEHIISEKLPEHEYASDLLESLRAKK